MKSKVFALLILLFSVSTNISFAQNFQPGSITFLSGQKDTGWIEEKLWNTNPGKIKFKSLAGVENVYTVSELESFRLKNSVYQRAVVSVDQRPVDPLVEFTPSKSSITDSVFLKLIILGKPVTLFQYNDARPHYYITTNNTTTEELIFAVNDESFKQQLRSIKSISWTNNIQNKLSELSYSLDDLSGFVKVVNDVELYSENNKKVDEIKRLVFFAGGGMIFQKFKLKSDILGYGDLKFDNDISPVFNAGVDILLGLEKARTAIRIALAYYQLKTHGQADYQTGSTGRSQHSDYFLQQTNIEPSLGISYNFYHHPGLKLFGGATFSYHFSKYNDNRYRLYQVNSTTQYTDMTILKFEKSWSSVSAQLGAVIKDHFEFRLNSTINGSFLKNPFTDQKVMNTSACLFYRF